MNESNLRTPLVGRLVEIGDQFPGSLHGNDSGLATGTQVKEVGVFILVVGHTKDMPNQAIGLIVQCGQAWSNTEDGVVQATV
jgi:hypothetical protein